MTGKTIDSIIESFIKVEKAHKLLAEVSEGIPSRGIPKKYVDPLIGLHSIAVTAVHGLFRVYGAYLKAVLPEENYRDVLIATLENREYEKLGEAVKKMDYGDLKLLE